MPWQTVLAAAAVIALLFAGWWTLNIPQADTQPPQLEMVKAAKVDHPLAAAISKLPANIQVSFKNEEEVIAVPIKSDNPNVTILWVYPAVKTANESDNSNGQPDSTRKEIDHEKLSKC
jgi:hypothetical protein